MLLMYQQVIDINNYSELTDLANEVHNKNWSPEEYASAYQDEVDLVNAEMIVNKYELSCKKYDFFWSVFPKEMLQNIVKKLN